MLGFIFVKLVHTSCYSEIVSFLNTFHLGIHYRETDKIDIDCYICDHYCLIRLQIRAVAGLYHVFFNVSILGGWADMKY